MGHEREEYALNFFNFHFDTETRDVFYPTHCSLIFDFAHLINAALYTVSKGTTKEQESTAIMKYHTIHLTSRLLEPVLPTGFVCFFQLQ